MLTTLNPISPKSPEKGVVVIDRSRFWIGRGLDCQLRLDHPTVGRHHCELSLEGDTVFVRDLESLNGTYVNHQKILEKTQLNEGDLLEISMYLFRVESSSRVRQINYCQETDRRSDQHWEPSNSRI